jgi:hypothetical protein
MSDENDGDDLTECPVCGTPVFSIVIRGPSPAERYAQPCGHRLPAEFSIVPEPESEDKLDEWQARLTAHAGDGGGGCLETAQAVPSAVLDILSRVDGLPVGSIFASTYKK